MSEYSALADLQPSEDELAALLDVLDEVEAVNPPGGDEDYGPWRDDADLAAQYEYVAELADGAIGRERIRAAEDAEDARAPRRSFDDKLKRAMDRASRGTLAPGPMDRDRSPGGRFTTDPETACGAHRDDFGRCGARYHDAGCLEVFRASAATSDADAVGAWNQALLSGAASSGALLASHIEPGWDELLSGEPGPGSAAALEYMREQLGIGGRADLPRPPRPIPDSLAEELGLR